MSKNKVIGYVILARDGDGFKSAPEYDGDASTLWFGSHLSLFKTRKQAQQYITRTVKFAARNGYDWPWLATAVIHLVKVAQ